MEHNENVNKRKPYGGILEIPVGSHLALFFSDEDELRDIVCPLLEKEINQNRRVVYIRNGVDVEWIKRCIENYNPDKHERFLKAWTATDISLRRNGFTPRTLLELLQSETNKSSEEGLSGLTIMLEVTNVLMQLFLEGRFMDFFTALQDQLAMTTNRFIFQYNLSKLDKRVLHMIMTEHPCLLHDNEIEFNPFYTKKDESPAKRFISHVKSLNLLKLENEGVKSKNQELQSCKQKLEDTVSALKNEMKRHEDELLRIKDENKQKVERIERIQEQLKIDQREIQDYKDKETALQEQLKRKIRSIEDLQKNFDIFKLRHSKFEEEIKARDEKNNELTTELTGKETLLREKENILTEKNQIIDSLKQTLETTKEKHADIEKTIRDNEVREESYQSKIETLEQTLREKEDQIIALQLKMEKETENYQITQQAFEEYKEVNADLVRETESLNQQLVEINRNFEQAELDKEALEEQLQQARLKISTQKDAIAESERVISEKTAQNNDLENKITEVQEQNGHLKMENQSLQEKVQAQEDNFSKENQDLTSQIATQKTLLNELKSELSQLQSKLKEKEKLTQEQINKNEHIKTLLQEKEALLDNKNRQIYRFSSLYEEFKQKASVLNDEKLRIEKKYTENMHKVSSSLKSIKAHHDLDKQKLDDSRIQVDTLKETVKKLTAANEEMKEVVDKEKKTLQELRFSLDNTEKQNTRLRDILKQPIKMPLK